MSGYTQQSYTLVIVNYYLTSKFALKNVFGRCGILTTGNVNNAVFGKVCCSIVQYSTAQHNQIEQ